MDQTILKTKLFHPLLVVLCSIVVLPLFLFGSYTTLQAWLRNEGDNVPFAIFIFVSTISIIIWGINALRSVFFRPKILINAQGVFFDITNKSRSWGTIPWNHIVDMTVVQNKDIAGYIFIYLSEQSPLYSAARKDCSCDGRFIAINTRYIARPSHVKAELAKKLELQKL